MAFIRVENIVINTNYIAAIKLESETDYGEKCISILLAIPKLSMLQMEGTFTNAYHCEWLDFTGKKAQVLQDYFMSFNHVIDLLPQG